MPLKKEKGLKEEFQEKNFRTEEEEANWWDSQQDVLAEEFERAAAQGTLTRGTVLRKGITPTTTIRLAPEDILLARNQAERRGLKYQTYLKMVIHQALREEEAQRRVGMSRKTSGPAKPRTSRSG